MQRKHARLLVALSLILLFFVALDFFKISEKNRAVEKTESKIDLVEKVNEVGKVLAGIGPPCDTAPIITIENNSIAQGQSIGNSAVSSMIVCFSNTADPSSKTLVDEKGHSSQVVSGGQIKDITLTTGTYCYSLSTNSSAQVFVKVGPNPSKCSWEEGYTAPLSPPPTASSKKTTTTTKTVETVKVETIKDVSLPETFTATGTTTNLAAISDISKVENLTLDTAIGTIKFTEVVDLSSTDTKDKFKDLDKYVKVDQKGVISIDSISLAALNKKATLTMKGLSFVKTPKVLYNGKEDKSAVSNIKYSDGVLTFDVTKFSTFTAAPTVGINEPANNFETTEKTVKIKGSVSDPTASVSAKLNNKDLGALKVAINGAFEKEIDLVEGDNNIVVSALAQNLATTSASISGVLKEDKLSLLYVLVGLLALIGIGGLVYAIRKLNKKQPVVAP